MAETEKELQQLKKRFADLALKASMQGIFTFTHFLSLVDQDAFWQMEKDVHDVGYTLFGGIKEAERVMIRFGDSEEFGYETDFPICCIHVVPLLPKFADRLTHRDFLGALMNLGIERDTIGDIIVGEKEAYLFCMEKVSDFICENLDKVKHTSVKCVITDETFEIPKEDPERIKIQAASLRADAVIAKVYRLSRNESMELFQSGRVFINGRSCENNSRLLKVGETVNVRGFGKFNLNEEFGETKKGKISIQVVVYR